MDTGLQTNNADDPGSIDGLRQALDTNRAQLLETAKQQWERNFAGKDPSDACVKVRVTSGKSKRPSVPCTGIIRKRRRSLLNGGGTVC